MSHRNDAARSADRSYPETDTLGALEERPSSLREIENSSARDDECCSDECDVDHADVPPASNIQDPLA